MGHASPNNLRDISGVLKAVSKWDGIKQKSSGIFYLRSKPFLHFHDKEGERWAHVKNGKVWRTINLPFKAGKKNESKFLKQVRKQYLKIIVSKK